MTDENRHNQPPFSDESRQEYTRLPEHREPPLPEQITEEDAREIGSTDVITEPLEG